MKTPLGSRPWRSLLLLAGASSVVALSSCVDRDPVGADPIGPRMSQIPEGGAPPVIDGNIGAAEWAGATCFNFQAPSTGGSTVTATFCARHDDDNWYWSLASERPWSNGGDVLRVFLRSGEGATLWDEIRWQQSYAGGDRYWTSSDNFTSSVQDAIQDGVVVRSGAGGSTSFEGSKPRVGDANGHDLNLVGNIEVRVLVEQSDRSGSSGWRAYAFDGAPPPPLGNVQVVVRGIPHTVTDRIAIVARDADRNADLNDPERFDVQPCWITTPGECVAWFNVTGSPVFSAEPTRIRFPEDHILWANHRAVEVFSTPTLFEATVFVQNPAGAYGEGSSARKIDTNLNQAYANALPVPEDGAPHTIMIQVQTQNVQVVPCSGNHVTTGMYLFAGTLFNPNAFPNIPANPGPNSPAIAGYVGLHGGAGNPCQLVLAQGVRYIVKGKDYQGKNLSGSCTTENCNLTPDFSGDYVVQHYIPDPVGDGNPDSDYMTFGLLEGNGTRLHWKVNSIGLLAARQRTSTWEFEFIYQTAPGGAEQTLKATVICNRQGSNGACVLDNVNPRRLANLVLSADGADGVGRVHPTTGVGYAQIVLDVTNIQLARLRARSVDSESPKEFVPDQGRNDAFLNIVNGYVLWSKQADIDRGLLGMSRSLHIPF